MRLVLAATLLVALANVAVDGEVIAVALGLIIALVATIGHARPQRA